MTESAEEAEGQQNALAKLLSQQDSLTHELELNRSEMETLEADEEVTAEELTEFRQDVERLNRELGRLEKDVKALLEQLERIYILDGPGLCPEVMVTSGMERIDSRCTRIIPRFSVVGKLFEPKVTDSRIVRSTASGMLQHALASWGIDHGELALCEENDPRSRWINASVDEWIGNLSQADRVILIHDLFDALSANGARTLEELDDGGATGFETILRRLLGSSESTKKAITNLPKQAMNQAVSAASRLTGIKLRLPGEEPRAEEPKEE